MNPLKWLLVALAAAAVLTAAWLLIAPPRDSFASTVLEDDAVLIMDQPSSDSTVVSYAKLSKPGFIVVSSTEANGKTQVLGTSDFLPAGEYRHVLVKHSGGKRASSGSSVTATVVADDGDESFDPSTDTEALVEDDASADASAEVPAELTDEELSDALDEAGYTVVSSDDDVLIESDDDESVEGEMEIPTDGEPAPSEDGDSAEDATGATTTAETDASVY